MIVRKLRVTVPSVVQDALNIDNVDDPLMLAHRLMNLESRQEEHLPDRRLRMSMIANVCVRGQLIAYRSNISTADYLSAGMRVTFDIGNAIHLFFQNSQSYLGERRLGWWQCLACGTKVFGRKPQKKCGVCGASDRAALYHEHALRMPEKIPVSGHIDCFLEVAPGDIRVLDFKTINGEEFEKLKAPKADHVIQVTGYMKFIQYDETFPVKVNPDKGLVLYISKKHVAKGLPFKMFHVQRLKIYEDLIDKKIDDFKRGLDDTSYLPEPLDACVKTKFSSSFCRLCPVVLECSKIYGKA